ncbi:UDP-3-O-acyl-N-acetylglucosamine deacetylase [Varunaivibrio sulfuroxidans]|uniref:UDP-3-O-acyl-N-acetylglucosamine deacetylase n=1 Tax=Varunaivibrio sulfuroxidans TaxID=1773489 RepID=A0A4V2UNI5_9PROT|nr:UDP-3-O-acyl-N-acetylglucosamine deacetylase [Varunaivibrio sulfuroxidans]TCS62201.1 UDP-3-O-[3-hydroxymyristoyl] N-acetylglucosamine deacetylase [Varunaivibrio sulfuroxidans]WES30628.1 UDP-3-O-acyl-N-acetylglucosamine deacetylase [Varunaivibrio sulfuroxidans]
MGLMDIDRTRGDEGYVFSNAGVVMQKTLKAPISCTGVALHSGKKVTMRLIPGAPGSGVVFKRTDIQGGGVLIPATWDNVVETRMCTVIGRGAVTISTVEHLMSALAGAGIDNVLIEINGAEVPAMDGSAAPFLFLIECAGVCEQAAPRRAIRVLKEVIVDDGARRATLSPRDGFSVDFQIDFDNARIARQTCALDVNDQVFKKEISSARTFGFLNEVEQMRAAGLARGGSLHNAVVLSGDTVMNEDGLRYEDEFVRHKILDAIGDLYLAGGPIIGAFSGMRSGHDVNNRLLRALFKDADAWTYDVQSSAAPVKATKPAGAWSKDTVAAARA